MSETTGKPITGWHVLIGLIVFFGVVFTANGVLTWYALESWSGLEVENSYDAGKLYPDEIAAAKTQDAKKWKVAVETRRDGAGTTLIRVAAHDAGDSPLNGLNFSGKLTRPIDSKYDHSFAFETTGRGLYEATVSGVEPGQWDLIVEAKDGAARVFRSRNRVLFEK